MVFTAEKRALAGGALWLGFVALIGARPEAENWTHALLLFAVLVLVPLALELWRERNDAPDAVKWLAWAAAAQLPAGVLLALACWLPRSIGAALLAVPWFGVTLLFARIAILRVLRHGFARPLSRLCADAAFIYSAVGGLWAVADRAAAGVFGFDATIVALTAVHFHFAGMLLPLFTGLAIRDVPESRFAARVAVGTVLAVPAVALGIMATRFGAGPAIETATGVALALCGACVAVFHLRIASETSRSAAARALLGIAGVALFCAMVLAAAYAVRPFAPGLTPWLGLPQMRALHGTLNAFGVGLCGVLGWRAALTK